MVERSPRAYAPDEDPSPRHAPSQAKEEPEA